MAHPFGSPAWAKALEDEVNSSSEYRNAAARWGDGFNGNVLLVFDPDEAFPRRVSLLVRLAAGRASGAEFVEGERHPDAGFTLRAPFSLWKQILERKALAATAILGGKMKVEGDKMKLLKHTSAHRALLHCAASVDTAW